MVFSSVVFLFLFLPVVLALHLLAPRRFRNLPLLAASLVFYAWGEKLFVLLMVGSISANYIFGLLIERTRQGRYGRLALGGAVAINLVLLAVFKYSNFVVANLGFVMQRMGIQPIELQPVHLPIGISFFTFQAMSYVIDVYRRQAEVQRNPINVALYISLFPQLIAGPIVRYRDIAAQLAGRVLTREGFAGGIRRFIVGLGKKVLIANTVAVPADQIFALPVHELTPGLAWLGIACYTIQIYFDFSGYSDMAIGLGRMLGFRFLENFDYPYISRSIREFWRRWHISLSSWFRDYLFIPLGGSRRSPARVYFNLVTVFFLCGLWHGASWTFVVWGLYHGFFLVVERLGIERKIAALWKPFGHLYAMPVVIVGWVLFRSETITQAGGFLATMAGFAAGTGTVHHASLYLTEEVALALVVGAVGSTPVARELSRWREQFVAAHSTRGVRVLDGALAYAGTAVLVSILIASAMWLSAGTYNPFIYFRF